MREVCYTNEPHTVSFPPTAVCADVPGGGVSVGASAGSGLKAGEEESSEWLTPRKERTWAKEGVPFTICHKIRKTKVSQLISVLQTCSVLVPLGPVAHTSVAASSDIFPRGIEARDSEIAR